MRRPRRLNDDPRLRRLAAADASGLPEAESGVPLGAALALSDDDHELIAVANEVLSRHYKPFWHTVAAAVRGRDGRIWTGLHLGATVGRLQICAEAVAVGRAILDGDGTIATAVAVRHPKPDETDRELAVVPPCGACRDLILDYSPDALVILPGKLKRPLRELLPVPYRR